MNPIPQPASNPSARIAADLAAQGWSCCQDFLARELTARLRSEAEHLMTRGAFQPAAVGSGAARAVRPEIRGDDTCWLDERQSPTVAATWQHFEALRRALNAELQLGLFEFEAHFARYRPGHSYAPHFDRLSGIGRRLLSAVLYLNEDWRAEHGGALRLYSTAEARAGNRREVRDFLPQDRHLMLFLSERFEHEVLPATRERLSISGWFLARA
ncbi:MAG TPA: 2OG-Fe(II) oxygenase [Steroidobacteraceae bacterium]|nr:2OG-Fe(II) oxygenase [Steroidobacteraceae bacterium]